MQIEVYTIRTDNFKENIRSTLSHKRLRQNGEGRVRLEKHRL